MVLFNSFFVLIRVLSHLDNNAEETSSSFDEIVVVNEVIIEGQNAPRNIDSQENAAANIDSQENAPRNIDSPENAAANIDSQENAPRNIDSQQKAAANNNAEQNGNESSSESESNSTV